MKNPFTVNPSSLEFLLCPPIRLAQADSDRENISWTEEQCRYAAQAINQHDKLVAELDRLVEAGKAYQDLCTCYRIGKQPTEKLFKRLDDAKTALLREEKNEYDHRTKL